MCSGTISSDTLAPAAVAVAPTDPSGLALSKARRINLKRAPKSPGALALVEAVADLVIAHGDRKRPIGPKGRPRLVEHVGMTLAGLLREGLKGRPVAAQRRPGGTMWDTGEGALIGRRPFWGVVDAMDAAGLVGQRMGTRRNAWATDDPIFKGVPSKLWATSKLLDLAAAHGVTLEGRAADWKISAKAEAQRPTPTQRELVEVAAWGGAGLAEVPAEDATRLAAIKAAVAALNERVASVEVRGCPAPIFRRTFRGTLDFGGRLWAIGGEGNYQQMPAAERASITINGEPVVEVDISAAFLTIFLGLSGRRTLPKGDLYRLPELAEVPREAIKAWMAQSFMQGKAAGRWAAKAVDAHKAWPVARIRKAMIAAYPELADMGAVLPPQVRPVIPEGRHGYAVGAFLMNVESEVMAGALGYLAAVGEVGLPIHDGVVVRRGAASAARAGLSGAMMTRVGIVPRLK